MPPFALILARAGSRGVPGKNTAPLAGRPAVAYTIDAALAAATIGREHIALSTDDPAAAAVARGMGIAVIDRPANLAHDRATVDDAARHAIASVPGADPIVILYANVPIRPPGLIDRAVNLLRESGADSVQSYAPVGKHHPYWTARLDAAGAVSPWQGDVLNHNIFRRQDLPPAYIPDGGVLVVTRAALLLQLSPPVAPGPHAFFGRDRRGVINPENSVIDIDTPLDLAVASAMLASQPAIS